MSGRRSGRAARTSGHRAGRPARVRGPRAGIAWKGGHRAGRPARASGPERADRGAASIFVLAVGLVTVSVGMAGTAVVAARTAKHQAQIAADLGALAGARHAVEGRAVACAEAARLVAANGGRMAQCTLSGLEIVIRAEVVVTLVVGGTWSAARSARGGPVGEVPAPR